VNTRSDGQTSLFMGREEEAGILIVFLSENNLKKKNIKVCDVTKIMLSLQLLS
jgi:hypothetical protein